MSAAEEAPPIRPRIEQAGEKIGAVVLVVVGIVGLVYFLNQSSPLDFPYMANKLPVLLQGAQISIFVTALAYLGGMGIGFLMGWLKTSKRRAVRGAATVYAETIRGTPLFVQILFIFAVLSYVAPLMPNRGFITGLLALLINTSGYQSEIFRAGLQSVAAGQVEAAKAVGLSYWGSMRSVILPQALRLVVPPLTNEFIALLKSSSLLFFIGIQELTYEGRILSFGGKLLEVYAMVFAIYLMITLPLGKVVAWLERRYRTPGLGLQQEPTRRRNEVVASATTRALSGDLESRARFTSYMRSRQPWRRERDGSAVA